MIENPCERGFRDGNYSVNPYVGCAHACKYCFASFMKRFTNHPEPWGSFEDVKCWPDIKNPKRYAGKELFIASVTAPYQPLEETYGRTRALLEQVQGSGCTVSIATKSDLVLHAGVRTTCFISPIFPGITDLPAIIRRAKEQCNLVWLENLNHTSGSSWTISRRSILTWFLCMTPSITRGTAAIGPHWMRRRLWSIPFSTRRLSLPRRKPMDEGIAAAKTHKG